ncbi:MAG: discoidin domain-containing protein [Victivallaceae bacterium]|jgi:hypothetical protein
MKNEVSVIIGALLVIVAVCLPNIVNAAQIKATASSEETDTLSVDKAVDGDRNTRWSSVPEDGQWLELDLGAVKKLSGLKILWETAFAKEYEVLVSNDKPIQYKDWKKVYSTSDGAGGQENIKFDEQSARFIRLNLIKRGTGYGFSIFEIALLPEAGKSESEVPVVNTSSGIKVRASSVETPNLSADKAIDGDVNTRWSSVCKDEQWIEFDFGIAKSFDGLTIIWELAFAREYNILVSNDGKKWKKVYSTKNGAGGTEDIKFAVQNAQYLKIDCTRRGTQWGNSIFEVKLH